MSIPINKASQTISSYSSKEIQKTNDRTNFLLLGIGGTGHDAPDLADTIILASYRHSTSQITLLSIPRDIWLPSLKTKINTTYYYGQQKTPDGGILLAKSAISEITGAPVHYAVVLDFNTFKRAIDIIGGIEVNIAKGFVDEQFPIAGKENDNCSGLDPKYSCRYEIFKVDTGTQFFNGETALKYVRSRHSTDLQTGTDFSRNTRQKEVLSAIKNKLFSTSLIKNPNIYSQLFELLTTETKTDISQGEYVDLLKMIINSRNNTLLNYSLNDPEQLTHPAISPLYLNQWVLIPKDNNPKSITDFVNTILN